MNWKVPLADISFGTDEFEAVRRVMQSGWISMGPETELFESEFARYFDSKHAVAVSSGTAALHLALLALGIGPGDEVIVPSLTFVATANAILYVGATPVFADITSVDDWNISPDDIAAKITPATRAVMAVHYGGFACRMDRITEMARQHGLKIVEDAAHAPGAFYQGKDLGTWGDAGCFSFFSNKNMTTGEGGMVVTDDDGTARRLRILRSHGMTTLTWDRHRGHSFSYDVVETGYNYRIDEIRAALGRVQLTKLKDNQARRHRLTRALRELLKDVPRVNVPFPKHSIDGSSCHIFPITLQGSDMRPAFMQSMQAAGIQTSIHYPPVHKFSTYGGQSRSDLINTEDVALREVTLPLFPSMSDKQLVDVAQAVRNAIS